ncbi:MAG: helix-turn-helix transcriptional regulator [Burkholderiales bacterium]|nr:helix-turn-helix transcriptional regulator [Burkholderiales bacterium]
MGTQLRRSLATAPGGDLYRAAATPDALMHVAPGHTLYLGSLDAVGWHVHPAPVLLAGLHGAFGVRVAGGEWIDTTACMIPTGVVHELAVREQPIAVLYPQPQAGNAATLLRLLGQVRSCGPVAIGRAADTRLVRDLHEDLASLRYVAESIDDLLAHARGTRAPEPVDPRIGSILRTLHDEDAASLAEEALARQVDLSASRLRHLFTREVGVPLRRYRAWTRLRLAIGAVTHGANLTDAAHAAGFFDSAHFSRTFRGTFGVTPSSVLPRIARIHAPATSSLVPPSGSASTRR